MPWHSLSPKANVKHDRNWKEIESADLVTRNTISFKIGDIVPADCCFVEAVDVSIDQVTFKARTPVISASGKSLLRAHVSNTFLFPSPCKQGVVISSSLLAPTPSSGVPRRLSVKTIYSRSLAEDLAFLPCRPRISFCLYTSFRYHYRRGINAILVLLIDSISIAVHTVLSVTLAVGTQQLAKDKAIVTRITTFEELPAVTTL